MKKVICLVLILTIALCATTGIGVFAEDIKSEEEMINLTQNGVAAATVSTQKVYANGLIDGVNDDGSTAYSWVYNSDAEQTATIDLGGYYFVSEIKLYTGYKNDAETNAAEAVQLSYSITDRLYTDIVTKNEVTPFLEQALENPTVMRYVKLTIPAAAVSRVIRVRELEVYGAPTGLTNLTQLPGASITSSNQVTNTSYPGLIDGNSVSANMYPNNETAVGGWVGTLTDQTATIDLGEVCDIYNVSFYMGWGDTNNGNVPSAFNIRYSTDKENWTDLAKVTGNTATTYTKECELSARYISLEIVSSEITRCRELEVYGTCESIKGYTLEDISWSNQDGGNNIKAGDTVTVTASIGTGISGKSADLMMICKAVDGAEKMLKQVGISYIKTTPGNSVETEVELTMPEDINMPYVEAFIWDREHFNPVLPKQYIFAGDDTKLIKTAGGADILTRRPNTNQYVVYSLSYVNYDADADVVAAHSDLYRITAVRIYERTGVDDYVPLYGGAALCSIGEWEMAMQEPGAADHVGGYHGDEIASSILVEDGDKQLELREMETGTQIKASELTLVQISDVYSYNTTENPLAEHIKEYVVKDGILTINQQLTWKRAASLDHIYPAMLPIKRYVGDSLQVTDTTKAFDVNDISLGVFDTSGITDGKSFTRVTAKGTGYISAITYGKSSGLYGRVTMTSEDEYFGKGSFSLLARSETKGNDNKMYFRAYSSITPAKDDVWKWTSVYELGNK